MLLNSNNEPKLIKWKFLFLIINKMQQCISLYVSTSFNYLYFVDEIKIF
jgi:hypothetical protein